MRNSDILSNHFKKDTRMSTINESNLDERTDATQATQGDVARFYLRKYHSIGWYTYLGYVGWAIGRVLAALVPSLLISIFIADIQNDTETINPLLLIVIAAGLALFGELLIRITLHYMSMWQVRTADTILKDAHENIINKSLGFHANNFAGSLTTKANRLAAHSIAFSDTLHFNVSEFVAQFIFAVIIVGRHNPLAVLLYIVIWIVYITVVLPQIKKRITFVRRRSIMENKRTGKLVDSITNTLAIKSFAREDQERGDFGDYVDETGRLSVYTWQFGVWRIDPITVVFQMMMTFLPLLLILWQSQNDVDLSQVFLVFTFFTILSNKIWEFARVWRNLEIWLADAAEALRIIETPNEVVDADDARELTITTGLITLNEVTFNYADADIATNLYNDFSLTIPPKRKIGLVGPSGGGKTTLVKLLLRFMDIQRGEISIDDQNIAEVSQRSLREHISYIPQEPALFHRSIKDNIRYSQQGATNEQIIAAAKKAHAHEFIKDLPDGYDTLVGERGVKLSGGQRQRVAIARAFLKDAPILILDEATSALDSESEDKVQNALVKLMKGKTVVSIAHRLSTLKIMDELVVIQGGDIAERGTHDELLAQNGTYKNLWDHQSGGFLAE